MISLSLGGRRIDILPVVNGLTSEAEKVREVFGGYDAYAASLGVEGIEGLRKRKEIGTEDMQVSELDIVYATKMSEFGDVRIPSPAFCALVDACADAGCEVIPLDMNDFEYDTAYMECVRAYEFASEHRLAKKGNRKKMPATDPDSLAKEWDRYVSKIKGYRRLNERREAHIAAELADTVKYRPSVLAVIETERVVGVVEKLRREYGAERGRNFERRLSGMRILA